MKDGAKRKLRIPIQSMIQPLSGKILPDEDGKESPRQFATPLDIRFFLEDEIPLDGFGIFLIYHLMDSNRMVLTRNFESAGRCLKNIETARLLPEKITDAWWDFLEETVKSEDPYAKGIKDNTFYLVDSTTMPCPKIDAILLKLREEHKLENGSF